MNKFTGNNNNLSRITYPGITAEVIPGKDKIYEIVWNCGGLSVIIASLQNEKTRNKSLQIITNILESVKQKNDEIIFLTDKNILQSNKEILQDVGDNIFGKGFFALVGIEKTSTEKNPVSGLQINRSGFSDEKRLLKTIQAMPDAVVLSSIPFSDPRIEENLQHNIALLNLKNSVAAKSLQLLDLNSKKSNQLQLEGVPEMTSFIGIANNKEELQELFEKHSNKQMVIKDDEGAAGGTSINFIGNKDQQRSVISRLHDDSFPQLVFEFIEPTLIKNQNGEKFPTQFRPFLGSRGEILGGALKFPASSVQSENLFNNGSGKSAFSKQNNSLNSSSGKTHSVLFDESGQPISGFIFDKGYNLLDGKETNAFLENFLFPSGKRVSGETVMQMNEAIFPKIRAVQKDTNKLLDL